MTDLRASLPALSAREEGYEAVVITVASGTFNETIEQTAWARMQTAGCHRLNGSAAACERRRDWRNDMEDLGNLLSEHLPNDRNRMTSDNRIHET